jgi:hypothetical protein
VLWKETRIALFEQAADDRDLPARERLVSRVAFATDRDAALPELLERYLELQASGEPVHTWPVGG